MHEDVGRELLLERFGPEFARNPQPNYAKVRDVAPVIRSGQSVTLSRHGDVEFALRTPEVFSSGMGALGLGNVRPLIPLQIDPPEHRRYRRMLDPLFAPREVAKIEQDIEVLTNQLIDAFIDRGECEFNSEFAVPLPTTVFLRLLGLPIEELPRFLRLKDGIIRPEATAAGYDVGGGADAVARAHAIREETGQEIYAVFEEALTDRARRRTDDLLSGFVEWEERGEITRDEILDICYLLMIAGLDTVTDALDCSFGFFVQHAAHRQSIVDDPGLIPSAVEELLRWETPVPGVVRMAATETELSGCPIHAGDIVSVSLGAANTDPAAFPSAETVDFWRNPNPHLAFGGGVHRCVGSHLARTELRIALREFHRRIPHYRLPEGFELEYTLGLRQIENLPLIFTEVRG